MTDALLRTAGVAKTFGGLRAVDDVNLEVYRGEITGLIGPNGAGKTTLVNLICGELQPSSGKVYLSGVDITGLPPHHRARLGMVRTFQQVRLFPTQTVRMNVEVGAYQLCVSGMLQAARRARKVRQDEERMRAAADEALRITGLLHRGETLAQELSTGEQRLVGVARALAADPRVLILDEPAAGLNESETAQLQAVLEALRELSITVLVVEHNMRLIMSTCDRVNVVVDGALVASGHPDTVRRDERVIAAYLGGTPT
jgi:branched-chain amino acid transport system ATP-binding protein